MQEKVKNPTFPNRDIVANKKSCQIRAGLRVKVPEIAVLLMTSGITNSTN